MSHERFLLIGAVRHIANELFEASLTNDGCHALWILGELLDRRDVPQSAVGEIKRLSALAHGREPVSVRPEPSEWR
ncbi:hypothetical protein [Rhizorhapis suberifaciens]|uniref:Uncharacterized protein n=1 Tax=Rhizorhapis suberifaciens TaxID=13656 RepID=A0A840HXL0_9SPHN|nr:hypothetical protein [Rhizorhapis suberifaciens]MBB4642337.1 hypothetical protein [Rhizorhapis suberifaciens]